MFIFFIMLALTMGISLWAQFHVKSVFGRYSRMPASSGATGAEAAESILRQSGINDVEIVEIPGVLADHYDPASRRLVLSSDNFHGQSVAALGVAAHECGHAIQHQLGYAPLQMRMLAVGAVNIVNPLLGMLPLLLFTHLLPYRMVLMPMVACMSVIMLFNLITMPVEFDASRRAKELLPNMGFLRGQEEIEGVRLTLNAAGWTYVAAFVVSLLQLLYWLLPLLTGGRRD